MNKCLKDAPPSYVPGTFTYPQSATLSGWFNGTVVDGSMTSGGDETPFHAAVQ